MESEKEIEKELTEKQKIFCNEYIFDFNATRAYRAAYPDSESNNGAAVNANRLLRNTNIQAYINDLQKDLQKVSGISKLRVLKEFEKLGLKENEDIKHSDKIKALENINKMLGFNEPEKTDIVLDNKLTDKDRQEIKGLMSDLENEY